jgi:hypothetical protein
MYLSIARRHAGRSHCLHRQHKFKRNLWPVVESSWSNRLLSTAPALTWPATSQAAVHAPRNL